MKARNAARQAVESTYEGVCDIVEYASVKDNKSKITRQEEITVLQNQPCKLSFESISAAVQTETGAAVSQGIKLFIAPEIKVKNGSKIVIAQNSVTAEYSASGQAAVYASHQEIMLELWRGWA